MASDQTRLCAVITEATREAARWAFKQAAQTADLAEWRLDYLNDTDFGDIETIRRVLADKPLPIIVTCRSPEEGGQQQVDHSIRLRLLASLSREGADYCDVEAAHYRRLAQLDPDVNRLIVSYHNLNETPADLETVYRRVAAMPAAVHKVVTQANSITDAVPLFRLLERSRLERRPLIAMAMGEAGLITRVLGPGRGSFLTYASLSRGRESATGQVTCSEMSRLFRVHQITSATEVMGVIGNPISHSASPAMHNAAFVDQGIDAVYLPLKVVDVPEFFSQMIAPTRKVDLKIRGLSVTIPHKSAVISVLDRLDETATAAGAVNCVTVRRDGSLHGSNTDVDGAMKPLERVCRVEGTDCAVVGAGGAARAVILGLLNRGARVTVFARNPAKAQPLGSALGVAVEDLSLLKSSNASVLINTTPVGMRGSHEGESPVDVEALRGRRVVYDLVYNPSETQLLIDARAAGCETVGGIDMLAAQAALQFETWTGKSVSAETMREAALTWLDPAR
jgi:3-dehydroquinate dehydratase/shikimate dehydrogenase